MKRLGIRNGFASIRIGFVIGFVIGYVQTASELALSQRDPFCCQRDPFC